MERVGKIRVGRAIYDNKGRVVYPNYEEYTNIVVLMKSHSEWGILGPYELRDEYDRIMENILS